MKQFLIKPLISQLASCQEFATEFHLGEDDLILTNEYIYTPAFGAMNLSCQVMFQEKYGVGEPSDDMVEAMMSLPCWISMMATWLLPRARS
ncbi:MAG: 4-hydroxybutyrate dehydrogenase [Firmicutes bacterium]|nr:4-hydroxybutyrate dehydrogenase [Bacillota bacterium]